MNGDDVEIKIVVKTALNRFLAFIFYTRAIIPYADKYFMEETDIITPITVTAINTLCRLTMFHIDCLNIWNVLFLKEIKEAKTLAILVSNALH